MKTQWGRYDRLVVDAAPLRPHVEEFLNRHDEAHPRLSILPKRDDWAGLPLTGRQWLAMAVAEKLGIKVDSARERISDLLQGRCEYVSFGVVDVIFTCMGRPDLISSVVTYPNPIFKALSDSTREANARRREMAA